MDAIVDRKVRLAAVVAVLLAALALGVAALFAGDAKAGLGRVVALGDSFASGPMLGAKLEGSPAVCDRTTGGYPELLVRGVTYDALVNETCTGSTTSSLFSGSNTGGSWIRPQLDALNGDERVVTLTIGDNNASFGEVVDHCLFHNQSSQNVCSETYVSGGVNKLIAKGNGIAEDVGAALDAIHTRAPEAKIFLVGYLDIAPPDAAGCAGAIWLTSSDAPVFDAWERAINDTLRSVAGAHRATFVDAYAASTGHSACAASGQRWINPYLGELDGVPIHPNSAGSAAVAELLLEAVKQAGINPGPQASLARLGFRALRSAKRGASFTRAAPAHGGRTLTLALEAAAPVELKLEAVNKGRLSGGKCRPRTTRNSNAPVCNRYRSTGGWQRLELQRGSTKLHLTGRARGRALKQGWYRVRMRSAALPVVHPTSRSFKIVGPARG
jgi:lysophospholipase L1-like esterase